MPRQICAWISVGASVLAMSACGGDNAPLHNPISPRGGPPAVAVSYSVVGYVADTANRPLGEARIEELNEHTAGSVAFSDENGRFSFDRTFTYAPILRASKAGYRDAIGVNVRFPDRIESRFRLESTTPPVNLTGKYLLTFAADPVCPSLPEAVRTRTYSTTFPSWSAWRLITLGGAVFEPPGPSYPGSEFNVISVSVSENFASFYFEDPDIIERVDATSSLSIYGHAEGTITDSISELPITGTFDFCGGRKADGTGCTVAASCRSNNHKLTLTPQ